MQRRPINKDKKKISDEYFHKKCMLLEYIRCIF